MPDKPLFLFGTLRHPPVLAAVAGSALPVEPATLSDHAVRQAHEPGGETLDFPLIVPEPGSLAPGALIRPDAKSRARLDLYEKIFDYVPVPVTVRTAQGPVEALLYQTQAEHWIPGGPWSLDDWAAAHGDLNAEVAQEAMLLLETAPLKDVRLRFSMLAAHVASRRRARAQAAPATIRRSMAEGDVPVAAVHRPYARFFGVEENDLRFRRFDGSLSPQVNRAVFVTADAVTVLPYDPVRDRVMLVEQFRASPFVRGDRNPWTLEAIAGRIDAAETPEETAHRESAEEAGLTLASLHLVAQYYPITGAVTEFLYSYVGLADLPDGMAGVHGLASEAEDIRTHVLSFDEAQALVTTGEIANAPLILTLQWLALNRAGLRPAQEG